MFGVETGITGTIYVNLCILIRVIFLPSMHMLLFT